MVGKTAWKKHTNTENISDIEVSWKGTWDKCIRSVRCKILQPTQKSVGYMIRFTLLLHYI